MQDITITVEDGVIKVPLSELENKVKEIQITATKVPENTPRLVVRVKACIEGM